LFLFITVVDGSSRPSGSGIMMEYRNLRMTEEEQLEMALRQSVGEGVDHQFTSIVPALPGFCKASSLTMSGSQMDAMMTPWDEEDVDAQTEHQYRGSNPSSNYPRDGAGDAMAASPYGEDNPDGAAGAIFDTTPRTERTRAELENCCVSGEPGAESDQRDEQGGRDGAIARRVRRTLSMGGNPTSENKSIKSESEDSGPDMLQLIGSSGVSGEDSDRQGEGEESQVMTKHIGSMGCMSAIPQPDSTEKRSVECRTPSDKNKDRCLANINQDLAGQTEQQHSLTSLECNELPDLANVNQDLAGQTEQQHSLTFLECNELPYLDEEDLAVQLVPEGTKEKGHHTEPVTTHSTTPQNTGISFSIVHTGIPC
jgi:hypothetical protein